MKNNSDKKYAPIAVIVSVLTAFTAVCCAFIIVNSIRPGFRDSVKENVNNFLYQEKTTESEIKENSTARLMCAGNNVIYRSIYNEAASLGQAGAYDFSPMYENIKSIISQADVAAINQSSVLSDTIPVSTYPSFCSPTQAGDALYDIGFNVINHANKNVFDKGAQGACDTLDYWKSKDGVIVAGVYNNEAERNGVKYKKVNGIKISFLGFTESVAADTVSDSEINVISLGDRDRSRAEVYNIMKEAVKKAKEVADVAVVYMNFTSSGQSDEVNENQKQTTDYLVSFGADVVIGCGLNYILPAERITREDGTSAVVFYSLGNFLSAEEKKENMLGAVADIIFEKNGETGEAVVKSAKAIPVVTYYEHGYKSFAVLPGENISGEDLESHALNTYSGGLTAEYVNETFASTFSLIPDADFSSAEEKSGKEDETVKAYG